MPDAAVMHIVGARPNFPKAAPVIRALDARGVRQRLIHTGQHYDRHLSEVFFRQLRLPEPDVNLGVGAGSPVSQIARCMTGLEELMTAARPALAVVYGDVNSALAAALVGTKLGVPVAHVEAGLRSFDRSMPEEINRIVVDRVSDLLFATSPDAVAHLGNEGIAAGRIHFVGNPMIDTLLENLPLCDVDALRDTLRLPARYLVATLHRPSNVDDAGDAAELVKVMHAVADRIPVVLPLHPRGRDRLENAGLLSHPGMHIIEPLGYLEFIGVMRGAEAVVTDSGGVQEETTVLGVPCLTLRPNTERPITLTHGTNRLVPRSGLAEAVAGILAAPRPATSRIPPLWDGKAGERIAHVLAEALEAGCARGGVSALH